jgi:hypothetical protein
MRKLPTAARGVASPVLPKTAENGGKRRKTAEESTFVGPSLPQEKSPRSRSIPQRACPGFPRVDVAGGQGGRRWARGGPGVGRAQSRVAWGHDPKGRVRRQKTVGKAGMKHARA